MSDVPRLSPAEAHSRMKDEAFTYVDVRTEEEFEAGHPEGAVNVPLMLAGADGMTPNPDFLAVMQRAFARDAPLIVGCKSGNRSMRAARALLAAGFTRVLDQRAGWDGAKGTFGELLEPGWSRCVAARARRAPRTSVRTRLAREARRARADQRGARPVRRGERGGASPGHDHRVWRFSASSAACFSRHARKPTSPTIKHTPTMIPASSAVLAFMPGRGHARSPGRRAPKGRRP